MTTLALIIAERRQRAREVRKSERTMLRIRIDSMIAQKERMMREVDEVEMDIIEAQDELTELEKKS